MHDPGDSSDKLLLDIKRTISEFELEGIKARLIGGQRSKVARGDLRIPLPIGLAYDEDGKVALDGDRQIVEAIRLVFQAFRDKGSAMAAAKWFRAEGLRLPPRRRWARRAARCAGACPTTPASGRILKNPRYAGAFSYGRTTQRRQADGSVQYVTLPREQWQVCSPDLHAGFITWEEYCRNQETLARNAEAFASLESRRAVPREGAALLQSLMVCGRCGQRMSVHYSKARPARNEPARVYYQCREPCGRPGEGLCQSNYLDIPLRAVPVRLFSSRDHATNIRRLSPSATCGSKARGARSSRCLVDDSVEDAARWALSSTVSHQPRPRGLAQHRRRPLDRNQRPRLPSAHAQFHTELALRGTPTQFKEPRK